METMSVTSVCLVMICQSWQQSASSAAIRQLSCDASAQLQYVYLQLVTTCQLSCQLSCNLSTQLSAQVQDVSSATPQATQLGIQPHKQVKARSTYILGMALWQAFDFLGSCIFVSAHIQLSLSFVMCILVIPLLVIWISWP